MTEMMSELIALRSQGASGVTGDLGNDNCSSSGIVRYAFSESKSESRSRYRSKISEIVVSSTAKGPTVNCMWSGSSERI